MKIIKPILLIVVLLTVIAGAFYIFRANGEKAAQPRCSQPCLNMLRQIEAAKDQWAIENGATSRAIVTTNDMASYFKAFPKCRVANAKYIFGRIGEEPRCTFHGTLSNYNPDRY